MRATLLGLMAFSLSQTTAAADTMRCGDRLVATGATAAEVLGVCGDPADRRSRHLHVLHAVYDSDRPGIKTVVEVPVEVEDWTYNFGSNRLIQVLSFRDGILSGVEAARYGFDAPAPP